LRDDKLQARSDAQGRAMRKHNHYFFQAAGTDNVI
jgi:hypothetical protein